MPTGKEILDGIEFLKHGGPVAVLGGVLGYVFARPEGCTPLIGAGECTNSFGQHIAAYNGSATSYEWITPIIGCIIIFAVAGWLGGLVIRSLRARS